jgi:hypothetical protein
MSTSTEYFDGVADEFYYAKPNPRSSTPAWATDVVEMTEGVANQWLFTRDDDTSYSIFRRIGASPAATDEVVWVVPVRVANQVWGFGIGMDAASDVLSIAQEKAVQAVDLWEGESGGSILAAIEAIDGGGGGGTNGTGQHRINVAITRTTDDSAVRNVRIDIEGTDTFDVTGTDGTAELNVGNGEYTLIVTPPAGFESADDVPVTIDASDESVSIELVPITLDPPTGVNECNVAIDVVDQFGSPYNGVAVSATVGNGVTGADEAGILDREGKSKLTVDGRAVLTLIQGVAYTIRFEKGHQSKSFAYTVPTASSAIATEDF